MSSSLSDDDSILLEKDSSTKSESWSLDSVVTSEASSLPEDQLAQAVRT